MPQSVTDISRRHAIRRGLALATGTVIALGAPARLAFAQDADDIPQVDVADALIEPPVGATDDGTVPLSQSGDDIQPADEPPPVAAGPWGVTPVKLTIPALGIEVHVEAVGQDPDGAMSTPTDPDEVAWYQFGPGMGVPGNVVVAGHVNWDGRTRAFGELHLLDVGDVVQVIDAEGRDFEYAVESSRWVRAEGAPLDEIFAQSPEPMLTLITCGGEYVASRREYLDRLIVRARGA
jgi:hypothetical protein